MRPLLKHLGEAGVAQLKGLCTNAAGRDTGENGGGGVVALDGRSPVGGFTGVLGIEDGNASVFERVRVRVRVCASRREDGAPKLTVAFLAFADI